MSLWSDVCIILCGGQTQEKSIAFIHFIAGIPNFWAVIIVKPDSGQDCNEQLGYGLGITENIITNIYIITDTNSAKGQHNIGTIAKYTKKTEHKINSIKQ